MRRNEPSLAESLEDYNDNQFWLMFDAFEDYEDWCYQLFEDENWVWWLEQVDYDAVNAALGEDYY